MAPPNDNFANAILLTGESGTYTGDNIGSTAESGEFLNNGHTVWFKWIPPASPTSRFYFFSTRPITTLATPVLATEVHLFSKDFPTLEVDYIVAQKKRYGGNSPGSYVIIWLDQVNGGVNKAINGVYIRVDGVPELPAGQREGYFQLDWGPSQGLPIIGKCGSCVKDVGYNYICIDKFSGPADLNIGDYRQIPWVFNGKSVTSVERKSGGYPAGTYMVRYCSGYYIRNNFLSVYNSLDFFPVSVDVGSAWLFHSDVMAGMTLSRPDTRGTNSLPLTRPGDINPYTSASFGTFSETWGMGCQYVDKTGTLQNTFMGSVQQDLDGGGNPVGDPHGEQLHVNPCTLDIGQFFYPLASNTRGAVSDDPRWPSEWHTQAELQRSLLCDGHWFKHSGGDISFIYSLLRFSSSSSTLPEMFGGNISSSPYSVGQDYFVSPAGPPTWTLMRILPFVQITFVTAVKEANSTANGPKTARVRFSVQNRDVTSWDNVTLTPSGYFVDQDSTYYPSPPLTTTLPANDTTIFNWEFVMTNPVGDLSLSLSDPNSNPYPSITLLVTPLFKVTLLTTINYNGSGPVYAGKPVTKITLKVENIGNGTTLDCQMTMTPDTGTIAGGVAGHTTAGFQSSITVPIDLNPGEVMSGLELDIEQLSTGARTVKVVFGFSDSGNDFPPTVFAFSIPGL